MIYGKLCKNSAKDADLNLNRLETLMRSNLSVNYQINLKDFTGGIFINKRLPYSYDDIVYHNENNGLLVLLSGSIFNKTELYKLVNIKDRIKDPELVALLFSEYGKSFISYLNGEFIIFIYQSFCDHCYLYRDHLGVHPIGYTFVGEQIAFSTDFFSLCRSLGSSVELDSEYLLSCYKGINFQATPNKKVKKLPPGSYLEFFDSNFLLTKYWSHESIKIDNRLTHQKLLEEIRSLLIDAVNIRCDNRFNAGAHVSGGLDSGIVAALARINYIHQKKFYGFSWSPESFNEDNVEFDERKLVNETCSMSGITPVFTKLTEHELQKYIKRYSENYGYYHEENILEKAADLHVNLILSGFGGDEFISKADSGIMSDLFFRLNWITFLRKNPINKPKEFIKTVLYTIILPAFGILTPTARRMYKESVYYLKVPYKKYERKQIKDVHFYKSRRDIHLNILESYYNPGRTEIWTINGFRKGIVYRYPLLDKRIVEYMLKVPSKLLCKTDFSRSLLREISENILPESVRWKKSGSDPVLFKHSDFIIKKVSQLFIDEIDEWIQNPDLNFIDFDLLKKDIFSYKSDPVGFSNNQMFYTIAFAKAIHEFSKVYYS